MVQELEFTPVLIRVVDQKLLASVQDQTFQIISDPDPISDKAKFRKRKKAEVKCS